MPADVLDLIIREMFSGPRAIGALERAQARWKGRWSRQLLHVQGNASYWGDYPHSIAGASEWFLPPRTGPFSVYR